MFLTFEHVSLFHQEFAFLQFLEFIENGSAVKYIKFIWTWSTYHFSVDQTNSSILEVIPFFEPNLMNQAQKNLSFAALFLRFQVFFQFFFVLPKDPKQQTQVLLYCL